TTRQETGIQHREQATHQLAAGGRGSFGAPPVGPVDDCGSDNGRETGAFYRNATYTRDTNNAAPPLVLAELPIEPLDGEIRQYPAFRNRFLEIVESHPDLQPRHKLQYLLQHLRGEPHRFASGLQLTDDNYFVVVDKLEEDYGNQDMLRNMLLAEFINLRPPSNEVADLHRFHSEAFRVTSELKQLGDDVDASHVYEQILMGHLSEELRFTLIKVYGCRLEKSVSAILDGIRSYASDRLMAMNSGISWRPPAPSPPVATCRERPHSPSSRSSSETDTDESSHLARLASSDETAYSETAPLGVKESGAEVAVSTTPDAAYDAQEMPNPSGPAPLAGEDGGTARASSCSAHLAAAASEGAPPPVQQAVVNKQHKTAAVFCALSDQDQLRTLPPPDHAASVVLSSSSPSTDTERRLLIDDLVSALMALYGRTPIHELPSELMMHLPDAANPHYDALLDSILQYALRKAATQLVDNHPALLQNLPSPLTIADTSIRAGDKR
ncbi:hypothetical protein AAVH_34231, partial [Aphelenchoides avenae]